LRIDSLIGSLVFAIKSRSYPTSVYDNTTLLQGKHNLMIHPQLVRVTRDSNPEIFTAFDKLTTILKEILDIEEDTPEPKSIDEAIKLIAGLINNGHLPDNISEVESVQTIDCKLLYQILEEIKDSNHREETLAKLREAIGQTTRQLVIYQ
jgi:hypothetical protein